MGKMTKTTIRLPAALFKRAKHYSVESGRDLQDIIAEALAAYLPITIVVRVKKEDK